MDEAQSYSMKQTVELTGLSKDTLRYYEQIGALAPVVRDANGYRRYSQEEIEWLKMVKLLRATGIAVAEFVGGQQASTRERREYLERHQLEIQNQIGELHRIHEILNDKLAFLRNLEAREKKQPLD